MSSREKQSYYEILDVGLNANPEVIRTAYIRAKNAYNRDSLAAYSLFDRDESKRIIAEIEEAYSVLSDSDKRRRYDESHGIISSESVYDSYHKGNHAVAAFSRSQSGGLTDHDRFAFEDDPFRKSLEKHVADARAQATQDAAQARSGESPDGAKTATATLSPIDRLKAAQEGISAAPSAKAYQLSTSHAADPEMEEKIKACTNVNGAFLKAVREYKNVTFEEIMNVLKISKNYLAALEEDAVTRLPANVFVRGFVIQYAKALKLEHEKVASAYMEFLRSRRPG